MCSLSSSFQSAHISESKDLKEDVLSKPCNPWMEKDLQELGWSEFMKRKTEETLKSLNEKQIDTFRRKKTLARTASAPINISESQIRHPNSYRKKGLVRVSSTGTSHKHEGSPRITYDREFLLNCRESPLSLTPPTDLPMIPGATAPRERRPRRALEKTDSNISATSTSSTTSNNGKRGKKIQLGF